MSSIQIFDNFLPENTYQKIKDRICSPSHPWYFQNSITSIANKEPSINKFGFNFCIKAYNDDFGLRDIEVKKTFDVLIDLYLKQKKVLKKARIVRTRMDMTVYSNESILYEPHVDINEPNLTSIFYVNDSDGNTVIYNQKWNPEQGINQELTVMEEIEPVGNRLICFDGLHIHTGHNPMKHSNRILINTNFA